MTFESLRSPRDFARVMGGTRARRDGITLYVARGPEPSAPVRVGFAVPGSVGSAVVRNRVRRRLRAVLRELPDRSGVDAVVRASGEVPGRDFQSLKADVADLWRACA